jgi:cytochrome c-type biogenesis protein CcmE
MALAMAMAMALALAIALAIALALAMAMALALALAMASNLTKQHHEKTNHKKRMGGIPSATHLHYRQKRNQPRGRQ